jgi:hypothetical protein
MEYWMKIDWVGLRGSAPLIIPFVVNAAVTAWVVVAAQRALAASQCGISLPWRAQTTIEVLQSLFPAAWREVETLRRLSSPCIADLHADVSAAFLVASIGATALAVLLLPVVPTRGVIKEGLPKRSLWSVTVSVFGVSILLIWILYEFVNKNGFINFKDHKDKMRAIFNGHYIDLWNFWLKATVGLDLGILSIFCLTLCVLIILQFFRATKGQVR